MPARSYSGRAYAPLCRRSKIDVAHATNSTITSCDSPVAIDTLTTPFVSVFADMCDFGECHYLVVGDRLSGWVDINKTPRIHPIRSYWHHCLSSPDVRHFCVPEILDNALNLQLPNPLSSCRDGGPPSHIFGRLSAA